MNKINYIAPINNSTGYGITATNILRSIVENNENDVYLFPMGSVSVDGPSEKQWLENIIAKQSNNNFDVSAPCLKVWHPHDLALRVGKGKYVYDYTRNIGDNIKTSFVWASAFVLSSGYYENDLETLIDENSYNNFVKICQEELIRTYKLTLQAAIKNGKENVVLTSVGGGAFGNNEIWILEAIRQALVEYQQYPLKVYYLARRDKPEYKIFEVESNWERALQPIPDGARFASPISLSEIKKKRKKKEKKKTPEPQNIMMLERKRREEKLKNLMK